MTDPELLHAYVREGTDAAFAELVRRHQDMVYSVCYRRLGQAEQAQDAAQAVFLTLSRKAASLLRHPCPGGWLHRTACLEAGALARREANRQRIEQAMADPPDSSPQPPPTDPRLAGLDDALLELRERDRHALVLRFFEGRTLRELGAACGTSEEAARKRVDRALGKLSGILHRRGATACGVAALTALLAESTHAAPAGLLPSVAAAARQAGPVLEAATVLTLTKWKIAALCAVSAGLPAVVQWRGQQALLRENAALRGELSAVRSRAAPVRPARTTAVATPPSPRSPAAGAAEVPDNPLEQAITALLSAEALQVDASRHANLVRELELTPAQQEAAARILTDFRERRAGGIARLAEGKVTLATIRDVLRADLMAAEAFRPVLAPAQQARYDAFLAAGSAAFAESHANAELARLHAVLHLTEPQKDAVFAVLVAQTPGLLTLADDSTRTVAEVRGRWEALQQQEIAALEPLLDEAQRPVFQQQAALRRMFVQRILTENAEDPLAVMAQEIPPAEAPVAPRRLDAVDGSAVSIPAPQARATVLIFTSTTCPIGNGFAPELNRIDAEFRSRGVVLLLVQTEAGLTAAQARQHAADYQLTAPVLTDPERTLVKAAGATLTPEAVVLSPAGAILYRGRIDDRFRAVGQRWSTPRRTELRDALTDILAGRPVAVPRAPAQGCHIE